MAEAGPPFQAARHVQCGRSAPWGMAWAARCVWGPGLGGWPQAPVQRVAGAALAGVAERAHALALAVPCLLLAAVLGCGAPSAAWAASATAPVHNASVNTAQPAHSPAAFTPHVPAAQDLMQLTDDRGRRLRWARAPQRIVSLLPSLSETVCALGACERLVGVDSDSDWPSALAPLPRVGNGLQPNIEAIVALRPDVVLLAQSSRAAQRLESLGLLVVALEPKNHADVRRVLGQVGQLLGLGPPVAEGLWGQIDAEVAAVARSLPARVRATRVYFEVDRTPYGAGPTSFIGETLGRLGVQNILPPELGPFPKLNPEFVVRANPDLIMVGARHASGMGERPGWTHIRALRERRLCVFSHPESDVLVRPGPRLAEAARLMAACLREKGP